MRGEGFSFYFGGLGVEMCSLDTAFVSATVGNRWQPFATVDEDAMAVHMGSAEKVMTFGGFKRRATGFLAAGVALCDIATCFIACRKSFV